MIKDRDPGLWVNQPELLRVWQDHFLQSYLETLAEAAEEGQVGDLAALLKHWKTATNVIAAVRADIENIEEAGDAPSQTDEHGRKLADLDTKLDQILDRLGDK